MAAKTQAEAPKRERVNYAEITLAQLPEEKKFFKYEPKKQRLPMVMIPKAPKSKKGQTEVVADEAEASLSPERQFGGTEGAATSGLAPLTVSSATGLGGSSSALAFFGNLKALVGEAVMNARERKAAAATKPGSAWGSRIVPDKKPEYQLPEGIKPKIKEEQKQTLKQPSKLGKLKKEELFVKEKHPPIPPHKVSKKTAAEEDGKATNKQKGPANVLFTGGSLTKGSPNAFDPLAIIKKQKGKDKKSG